MIHNPELQEAVLTHGVTFRYLWEHGKLGDPTLRMRTATLRDALTIQQMRDRLHKAKQLRRKPKKWLHTLILIDEATVPWVTKPMHYIANADTDELKAHDTMHSRQSELKEPIRYILAVNYWGDVVYYSPVAGDSPFLPTGGWQVSA